MRSALFGRMLYACFFPHHTVSFHALNYYERIASQQQRFLYRTAAAPQPSLVELFKPPPILGGPRLIVRWRTPTDPHGPPADQTFCPAQTKRQPTHDQGLHSAQGQPLNRDSFPDRREPHTLPYFLELRAIPGHSDTAPPQESTPTSFGGGVRLLIYH